MCAMKTGNGDHTGDVRHSILAKRGSHNVVHLIARKGDRDKRLAGQRVLGQFLGESSDAGFLHRQRCLLV